MASARSLYAEIQDGPSSGRRGKKKGAASWPQFPRPGGDLELRKLVLVDRASVPEYCEGTEVQSSDDNQAGREDEECRCQESTLHVTKLGLHA